MNQIGGVMPIFYVAFKDLYKCKIKNNNNKKKKKNTLKNARSLNFAEEIMFFGKVSKGSIFLRL